MRTPSLIIACFLFASVATAGADDADIAAALEQIQGRWVKTVGPLKIEKVVTGTSEVSTIRDAQGMVLRRQRSDFRLEKNGRFLMLYWTDAKVLEGPGAGQQIPDGTMVFRVRDGKWSCANGLAGDEFFVPHLEVWDRPAAAPAP